MVSIKRRVKGVIAIKQRKISNLDVSSQRKLQFKQLQTNPKKISGLQRDSNPWPLRSRCTSLPIELWRPIHWEQAICWVLLNQWKEWNTEWWCELRKYNRDNHGRRRIYTCAAQVSPLPYGFCWSYSRLIIRKSMGKDIAYARRPVEGYEFAAWKFFKSSISQLSATSGNHHFVPTRHRNFNSSRGFITGLLLLCGDIFSQPGPRITKRTQNSGSSVPLKGLVINARSMKSTHKVGTSRVNNLDRVQDLVCSEHADIVLISETWLNGNILVQEFFPLSDLLVYR